MSDVNSTAAIIINRGRRYPHGFNHYDDGWNAFVDGKPFVAVGVSWRDGWKDACEAKAVDKI
jgi:hypothetical protein